MKDPNLQVYSFHILLNKQINFFSSNPQVWRIRLEEFPGFSFVMCEVIKKKSSQLQNKMVLGHATNMQTWLSARDGDNR